MKKFLLALGVIIILVIIFIYKNNRIDLSRVDGEILMNNPHLDRVYDGNTEVVIFNPKTRLFKEVNFSCNNPAFSNDKKKIIGTIGTKTIVEYDYINSKENFIFEEKTGREIRNPKYIPNRNAISFVINSSLHVLNLDNEKIVELIDNLNSDYYVWSKDGQSIYYAGTNMSILKYDIDTKNKQIYITDASYPMLSPDNNFFAYKSGKESIIIREIPTSKEWLYKSDNSIVSFTFSPDGKHLAILQEGSHFPYIGGQSMVLWNFNNNKKSNILTNVGSAANKRFDWK